MAAEDHVARHRACLPGGVDLPIGGHEKVRFANGRPAERRQNHRARDNRRTAGIALVGPESIQGAECA